MISILNRVIEVCRTESYSPIQNFYDQFYITIQTQDSTEWLNVIRQSPRIQDWHTYQPSSTPSGLDQKDLIDTLVCCKVQKPMSNGAKLILMLRTINCLRLTPFEEEIQERFDTDLGLTNCEIQVVPKPSCLEDCLPHVYVSIIRGHFLDMCFAAIHFADQITFTYINQSLSHDSKPYSLPNDNQGETMYSKVSQFDQNDGFDPGSGEQNLEEEEKQSTISGLSELDKMLRLKSRAASTDNNKQIKKVKKFKSTDDITGKVKTFFQFQLWKNLAHVIYKDSDQYLMPLQRSVRPRQEREDFRQVGFVDMSFIHSQKKHEPDQEQLDLVDPIGETFSQPPGLQAWKRNKPTDILEKCLFFQCLYSLREENIIPKEFTQLSNFEHIKATCSHVFKEEISCHMHSKGGLEVTHPHPLTQFRESLSSTFSLELDEPMCLGLNYAVPTLVAMRTLTHSLCVQDIKRRCDDGTILLCGESRSGKSEILDAVRCFFGGYEWLTTGGNFQSETIKVKSVMCVEEMDVQQLQNEKKGANKWKKRLDQTISADFDVKHKSSLIATKYTPFVITSNKKPHQIKYMCDQAFINRIKTVPFYQQVHNILSFGPNEYIQERTNTPEVIRRQRQGNLIFLLHFLWPSDQEGLSMYYLDDILTQHILKLLLNNKHSLLLTIMFNEQVCVNLKIVCLRYERYNSLQNVPNAPLGQTQANQVQSPMTQMQSSLYFRELVESISQLLPGNNIVNVEQDKNGFTLGRFCAAACQQKTLKPYYNSYAHLKQLIKERVPESNVKRSIITNWDNHMNSIII